MAFEFLSAVASPAHVAHKAALAAPEHVPVALPPKPTPTPTTPDVSLASPQTSLPTPPHSPDRRGKAKALPVPDPPRPTTTSPSSLPSPPPALAPFTPAARRAFLRVLHQPRTLAHLLHFLSWVDFHALSCASRDFRTLLEHSPACRDAVLAHWIPAYRDALHLAGPQVLLEIDVDMHDLALFVISQTVPLHAYPMHALALLGAAPHAGSSRPHARTQKLVELTQAHSRFVLLLQSLVHSPSPASASPADHDEAEDALGALPHSRARSGSGWSADAPPPPGVRALVFPAPLSYFGAGADQRGRDVPAAAEPKQLQHQHQRSLRAHRRGHSSAAPVQPPPPAERHLTHGFSPAPSAPASARRKSALRVPALLFGAGPRVPPPPPRPESSALRYYAGSWRRARTLPPPARRMSAGAATRGEADELGVDVGVGVGVGGSSLGRPQRRFERSASVNVSRESSLSTANSNSSPPSSSSSSSAASSASSASSASASLHAPSSPFAQTQTQAAPAGPHALRLATLRARAPVLRAFVPCTALDARARAACAQQLADAGLWASLSAGDVLVNFGYVPAPAPSPPGHPSSSYASPEVGAPGAGAGQRWLLFDGRGLRAYDPPAPPPLVGDAPLGLPSPRYYAHLLPPLANPCFVFAPPPLAPLAAWGEGRRVDDGGQVQLGAAGVQSQLGEGGQVQLDAAGVQLQLAQLPARVRTGTGWAAVQRWVWLARVAYPAGTVLRDGGVLGRGWAGEWVLEAEGTREGRGALLDALGRGRAGVWEVVRERCAGRVWVRLVRADVDGDGAVGVPRTASPENMSDSP